MASVTYADQFPDVDLPTKPERWTDPGTFAFNEAVVAKRKHAMAVAVDALTPGIDSATAAEQLAWMTARAVLDGLIQMRQTGIFGGLMGMF